MTFRTLIRRSLWFHWRSHLGVVLGAAVGSAALIGALVVGDSVRESLRRKAIERLLHVEFVLDGNDRAFTEQLDPAEDLGGPPIRSSVLFVRGTATKSDGSSRANSVSVYGVPPKPVSDGEGEPSVYWTWAGVFNHPSLPAGEVWLNEPLASHLGLKIGETLVLRLPKRNALSSEAAMSPRSESSVVVRLRLARILETKHLGDFSLRPRATPPLNAFVNLGELQQILKLDGRVNLILCSGKIEDEIHPIQDKVGDFLAKLGGGLAPRFHRMFGTYEPQSLETVTVTKFLQDGLATKISLADYEASFRQTALVQSLELVSRRVFVDPPIVRAALGADTNAQPILTYLATLLHAGTNATPYSMVTAAGTPWTPADLREDEIVVSQWLAEDLQVKPGDEIAMSYFLPESGAKLTEATNTFRVRSIVPPEMPWADRTLMPDFPGIEKAESTSEWDAGFPLTYKVRSKDDDYWKTYRGTPKAFITLAAGQKMWGNRFGNLTAIRFPIPTNAPNPLTPALSPSDSPPRSALAERGGERENRPATPSTPQTGERSTASGESNDARRLSPLPFGRGEGQGEGTSAEAYRAALEKKILANLKPEELGLRFEPVREQALKAAAEAQDFGGLFLGFSIFLIIAALLLMAMLFQFGLEQRAQEIGTLLALGFTPKQVRKLLLREGVALAFMGGVLGVLGGLIYAKGMLHGLTTIWRDAVGATGLSFHFTAQTLVIGLLASVVVSAVTISLTLRRFVKRPAVQLLGGEIREGESGASSLKSKVVGAGALLAALGLVGWMLLKGDTANAGAFFGAGALVLVAGLSLVSAWLGGLERGTPVRRGGGNSHEPERAEQELRAPISLASLAVRGCARRRKRSLGTVAMLACGSFLIVSIGVFRLDANRDSTQRSSGTGGFALIGETTMPVVQDLNSRAGRDAFALDEKDLAGVNFVPFRVREGDEASCLNLNRAQKPRLLGVTPEMLEGRFSFAKGAGWSALHSRQREEAHPEIADSPSPMADAEKSAIRNPQSAMETPAIGDANSIQWAMHKKVGDTIDYVDERGQPFKVRIVGAVANSILQGQLIIDEVAFVQRFPGESGYRMFLIDAPSNAVPQVSVTLSRAMQDAGLELTPAAQRLAQFNGVQNTYLGTFQVLGGLGLLLGSVGLGIVVLRNVLERRGELAVLMAVGFRKPTLQRLLWMENGALLAAGLGLGVMAAAVAVLPALLSTGAQLPYASLALVLGAVLVNGAAWTWAATRFAVRGDLLKALRNE